MNKSKPNFNPAVLEIDLFCLGLRIAKECDVENAGRPISRTRAGLGSGLELMIEHPQKRIYVNAPVHEPFAAGSPLTLSGRAGDYEIIDARNGGRYRISLPACPAWYDTRTASGVPFRRIGVLQGTYLAIYIEKSCAFWRTDPPLNCAFCTTGANVGNYEEESKSVEDVVAVCRAAKLESGVTFVHFNGGFLNFTGLERAAKYVKAVKEQVGLMVGLQLAPTPDLWKYDWLLDLGVNHFSICYEFHNPEYFARYLPGKDRVIGQDTFFRALEYVAKKSMKGSVSGEIIAGIEPSEDTKKAIDYITGLGAFPTVCIFRPTVGSRLQDHPSPDPGQMRELMAYAYSACMKNSIPIGIAPNLEVSIIVQPTDMQFLVPSNWRKSLYRIRCEALRLLAKPVFARNLRPHPVKGRIDLSLDELKQLYLP